MTVTICNTGTATTGAIPARGTLGRNRGTPCAAAIHPRIERALVTVTCRGKDVGVDEIRHEKLATDDPDGLFVNVNTPHDYERAKSLMDRMPGSDAAMRNPITEAGGSPAPDHPGGPHTT
jgi:hypothetical protein